MAALDDPMPPLPTVGLSMETMQRKLYLLENNVYTKTDKLCTINICRRRRVGKERHLQPTDTFPGLQMHKNAIS